MESTKNIDDTYTDCISPTSRVNDVGMKTYLRGINPMPEDDQEKI